MPLRGGGAALVKLDEKTGTGASGVLTFSAIPGVYRELELTIYGRSDTAATAASVRMTLNGDSTAANYASETGFAATTTPGAGPEHIPGDVGYLDLGAVSAASSTASWFSSTKVWIPEYANAVGFKSFNFLVAGMTTGTTGNLAPRFGGGLWANTGAITSIALTLSAGNWIAGSRATLWGIT